MQDLVLFHEAKICENSWLSQFQQLRTPEIVISCPGKDLSFRPQGAGSRGKEAFGIFAQMR
ncbi:MAG: hypothetical protein V7K41_09970 [Nostoc sp.]|uniref:hypothetical protein n=1 Tax=Nostoc sp. TaxID=1180 RepID=UPI002FF9D0C0